MEFEPIQMIAGVFIGFISGYLSSYIAEKGKNKAQLEDIRRLTQERKQTEAKYDLDIAQRKYAYEDKRTQYFKYFNLIDKLNSDQHEVIVKEFLPAMSKYTQDYLFAAGDKDLEMTVISWFSSQMQNIIFKGNEAQMRFRNETNAIKLIAGDKVLDLINVLHEEIDSSFQLTTESLKHFAPLILARDTEALAYTNPEISSAQQRISELQQQLIAAVKLELHEI